jgi:hypothetical protein
VILVVDADDRDSLDFRFAGLTVRRVIVEPGLPMGTLNTEGYRAATGAYLMLLNDDVVARSPAWDRQVRACFRGFPDDIVLVHTNDTLLREVLCPFPIVSRTFCELAGGICPTTYLRYRIDDHIQSIFKLLGPLGEDRMVYLPDVVFQHDNYVVQPAGHREYHSDAKVLAVDARQFDALAPERKELAVRLKQHIVDQARARDQRLWRSRLENTQDPPALVTPRRLRVESTSREPSSFEARVTIGLLTPNSRGKLFRSCLRAIQAGTQSYDLIVRESRRAANWYLARQLNDLLDMARTDYLLLMEDNTIVKPGWLDNLLRHMTGAVGAVTLLPRDEASRLLPDNTDPGTRPTRDLGRRVFTVCNPLVLIDTVKCRRVFFDESYRSPIALADFGLQVWEAGFEVIGVSRRDVRQRCPGAHPGERGRVSAPSLLPRNDEYDHDRATFAGRWLHTGRLAALERGIWANIADFQPRPGLDKASLVARHLEALLDLEKRRPPWREPALARLARFVRNGFRRARSCLRHKGLAGLGQALWSRLLPARGPRLRAMTDEVP